MPKSDIRPQTEACVPDTESQEPMRIVTRPDFDGIVCAVLLREAQCVTAAVKWVQPGDMQRGLVPIGSGDIVANLPYDARCALWFDHHISNRITASFNGCYELAPSAAGIIHRHYSGRFRYDYSDLVRQTDKIDSADLTRDQVLRPERYPHVIVSMTVDGHDPTDTPYWDRLTGLLQGGDIDRACADTEVSRRCKHTISRNRTYARILKQRTRLEGVVALTDFRGLDPIPDGNRFLVYTLFDEAVVQVKIWPLEQDGSRLRVSIGHSIFNPNCRVNVGRLLSRYGGGGHVGAGSCTFDVAKADCYLPQILSVLQANQGPH